MKEGDKVVCVQNPPMRDGETDPVKGCIYTIRDITDYGHESGVHLTEIKNQPQCYRYGFHEVTFKLEYFRPVLPIDLFNESEQEAYLEWIEKIMPGVETEKQPA